MPRRSPLSSSFCWSVRYPLTPTSFGRTPPAGSSVAFAPSRVQLWFSEEVEPSFSGAVIYDANRQRVDLADSHVARDDTRSIIVGVKSGLPTGTYVVAWKTQSRQDGHIVRGTIPFGVGVSVIPSDAAIAEPAPGPVSGSPAEIVLRWLVLSAAGLVVGAGAFWLLQGDSLERLVGGAAERVLASQRRLAFVGLIVFAIGNVGILLLQTAIAAEVSVFGAIEAPLFLALSQTQYGAVWIGRMGAAVFVTLVLLVRNRVSKRLTSRVIDWIVLGGGLAMLGGVAGTSHSAAVEVETAIGYLPLPLIDDWLHLVAFAIWIGGLAQLATLVRWSQTDREPNGRLRVLSFLVPRFSLLAGVCLAVVGVTGILEGLTHVGNLDNLLDTGYGQALLGKIVVIFPLLALAAVNHFIIRPAFQRARSSDSTVARDPANDVRGLFAWTGRVEVLLAVVVVAFAGILTSMSPAQQATGARSGGPLTLDAAAGTLQSTLAITPGRPGPNRYTVDVRDLSGQPVTAISRATLRLTFLDSDLGVNEVALSQTGAGRFEAQSSDLAIAGQWQAEAIFRRTGQDDVRATYQFAVTDVGGQTLTAPPPQVSILFFVGLLVGLVGLLSFFRAAQRGRQDLRRVVVLATCGIGLVGSGAFVSLQDLQRAQTDAASLALARFHPITPESVANGTLVYRDNCVRCHGADAHGNGPLAPTLNPRPSDLIAHIPLHADADLIDWITNGFPGSAMPAFKTVLTEPQRWDVLNYLKSISTQSATPVPITGPSTATASLAAPPVSTVQSRSRDAAQPGSTPPLAPAAPTPSPTLGPAQSTDLLATTNGALTRDVSVGDIVVGIKIQPMVFQPATVDLDLRDARGQPISDVTRVDLQVAMEGMNHGARGIIPTVVGPGRYHAQAMLFAMQGKWWLAIRIERANHPIDATVVRLVVPRDNSAGAVPAMYERPTGTTQIEDVAIYPDGIAPDKIAVVVGRPVRLELFFVDAPACGQAVNFPEAGANATISTSGLGELTFVPKQTGAINLTCTTSGLLIETQVSKS